MSASKEKWKAYRIWKAKGGGRSGTASQLEVAYKVEKEYWAKKYRVEWLQEGDNNTRFFHEVTAQRRVRNRIDSMENQEGEICEVEQAVSKIITNYFQHLFTIADPVGGESALDGIQRKITDALNVLLAKPIEDQEILIALFSISSQKALGPDGYDS